MAQLMPLPLTVSCFSKIQIGFTFLVPAHLGRPRQKAIKQVCVHNETSGPPTFVASWKINIRRAPYSFIFILFQMRSHVMCGEKYSCVHKK